MLVTGVSCRALAMTVLMGLLLVSCVRASPSPAGDKKKKMEREARYHAPVVAVAENDAQLTRSLSDPSVGMPRFVQHDQSAAPSLRTYDELGSLNDLFDGLSVNSQTRFLSSRRASRAERQKGKGKRKSKRVESSDEEEDMMDDQQPVPGYYDEQSEGSGSYYDRQDYHEQDFPDQQLVTEEERYAHEEQVRRGRKTPRF